MTLPLLLLAELSDKLSLQVLSWNARGLLTKKKLFKVSCKPFARNCYRSRIRTNFLNRSVAQAERHQSGTRSSDRIHSSYSSSPRVNRPSRTGHGSPLTSSSQPPPNDPHVSRTRNMASVMRQAQRRNRVPRNKSLRLFHAALSASRSKLAYILKAAGNCQVLMFQETNATWWKRQVVSYWFGRRGWVVYWLSLIHI